jgi:hypothetical protein
MAALLPICYPRRHSRLIPLYAHLIAFHIIQPSGKTSWALRYRFSGRPRKHTLAATGLKDARAEAHDVLAKIAKARKRRRHASPLQDLAMIPLMSSLPGS